MIVVHDWAVIPFFMMIWLAGLAGIPPELREAAHIDGAGPVRTFWNVELPQLRATAVLVAAISTINAFQTFTLQYVLAADGGAGGPANSTLVLGLLVLGITSDELDRMKATSTAAVVAELEQSTRLITDPSRAPDS